MIEATILIPMADNDGQTFSTSHHRQFEQVLLEYFGGFSRLPGDVQGNWIEDGVRYTDTLIAYAVAFPSIGDGWKVVAAAEFARDHYKQLAVFVRYLGLAETI
jgi:hypothetical protein